MSTGEVRFEREIPERRRHDSDDAVVAAKPKEREAFASKLEASQRATSKDAAKGDDEGPPVASKRGRSTRARRSVDDASTAPQAMPITPPPDPPRKAIARPEGGLDLVSAIDEVLIADAGREVGAPIGEAPPSGPSDPMLEAPTIAPAAEGARAALAFASILPAATPANPAPSPRPPTGIVGAQTNFVEARDAQIPWASAAAERAVRIEDPLAIAPQGASIGQREPSPEITRAAFAPREASPEIARPEAARSARVDADAPRAIAPADAKPHVAVAPRASASPRLEPNAEAPPSARVDRSDVPRAPRSPIAGEPLSPAVIQAVATASPGPAAAGLRAAIEGTEGAPIEENASDVAPADPHATHDPSMRLREGVAASKTEAPVMREALSEVPDRHAAAVAVSRLTRERSAHAEVEIPDLGRIAVTARAHAKDVDVALMASASSVDVLRAAGSDLASSLREAKIPLGSLHIGTGAGGGQGPSHNGDRRPDPSRGGDDVAEIAARSGPARRVRFVL